MDLRKLRQFVAVAEELHFGLAAERLHMTQPPLSQSIQALERELGVQLFVRTKRSVELSPVGNAWLIHVRKLLADAAALPETARSLSRGELGLLRLSFVSTADYSVLPKIISDYRTAYPNIDVSLREATSDLQIEMMLDDVIDAGLIISPHQTSLHQTISYQSLLREPLIAAIPEQWVLERRLGFCESFLNPDIFFQAPLILFPRRSAPVFHDIVSSYFAEHGAKFLVHQEAIQMQTIIGLVATGLGVSLVPQSMTKLQRQGAVYLPLAGSMPEVETGLIWRSADKNPALQKFLCLAKIASELS